jgi:hypothetical protein
MTFPSGRAFEHVLVIMFENQYRSYVMKNHYMRRLARQGIELANCFGVMHPSQTNYIASIAGELCDVTGDGPNDPLLSQRTIVDLIEEAPGGLSWKAYMESYIPQAQPWTPDLAPKDAPPYYVKHNPFASFASIVRSQERWRRIESESALFSDLLNGAFPSYAWFTPNIWNDGHYLDGTSQESTPRAPGLVDQAAKWLEGFFAKLRFPGPRSHLPPRTLVVVTFDEADYEADWATSQGANPYDGPNQIYTVLLGDGLRPGVEEEGYNHYSLLKTIEVNFGLGSLGKNDAGANWFQFLWGRRFRWGAPSATPIRAASALSAATLGGALYVAHVDERGALRLGVLAPSGWTEGPAVPVVAATRVAIARAGEALVLVYSDQDGSLKQLTYSPQSGFVTSPEALAPAGSGPFALQALPSLSSTEGGQKVMLVWQAEDGALQSRLWSGGSFELAVPVAGFKASGALTLGALGASLYLVFKEPGSEGFSVVSYNTAPFNAVAMTVQGYSQTLENTTAFAWSPSAFPVEHFTARPWKGAAQGATPDGELEPVTKAYRGAGPIATATLDGVLHLVHAGAESPALITETFSVAGLLTPKNPVSYQSKDYLNTNDGFGTLAQAGWSRPATIYGAFCPPSGALAMGRAGDELVLLFQREAGGPVQMCVGRYEVEAK